MYEWKNQKFFVISQIFQKITKSDLKIMQLIENWENGFMWKIF